MKYSDPYSADFSNRDPSENTDPIFPGRWSPRSFRREEIPASVLSAVFDAARWSPSCFNEQPWTFLTADSGAEFDLFLSLLVDANQVWAENASLIGFIVAARHFSGKDRENRWSEFDCGAAWMALTLQARTFGLYTHGMAGVRYEEVYEKLGIDKTRSKVVCGFALGILDVPEKLPEDLREREIPSARKPIGDIRIAGRMTDSTKPDKKTPPLHGEKI